MYKAQKSCPGDSKWFNYIKLFKHVKAGHGYNVVSHYNNAITVATSLTKTCFILWSCLRNMLNMTKRRRPRTSRRIHI